MYADVYESVVVLWPVGELDAFSVQRQSSLYAEKPELSNPRYLSDLGACRVPGAALRFKFPK